MSPVVNIDPRILNELSFNIENIKERAHDNVAQSRQKATEIEQMIEAEVARRQNIVDDLQRRYDACTENCGELKRQLDHAKQLLDNAKRARKRANEAAELYRLQSTAVLLRLDNLASAGRKTLEKLKSRLDDYSAFSGLVSSAVINTSYAAAPAAVNTGSAVKRRWSESITEDEKSAIRDYTFELPNYYKNINDVLRGKAANYDQGNERRSELIHSALSKAKTLEEVVVYRGVDNDAITDTSVGSKYVEKGFCSASLDVKSAFNKQTLFVIHLPAGSPAAKIEALSAHAYENEVLIDRGQMFKINSVHYEKGRRIIDITAMI